MNIVLIMTDQQKATSLPMYGNQVVKAPNLGRLASQGCLFVNGFTSCPICVPARVSVFTGQYPSTHGSLDNSVLLEPGERNLLRVLKDAGYVTGLVGKDHCFRREEMHLFDYHEASGHHGVSSPSAGELQRKAFEWARHCRETRAAWGYATNPFPPEALGTRWTAERAMDFVRENREKPFFLWFSIPDPHIPFQTCEPYASMYPPESVDMPAFREGEMEEKPRAQQIDRDVMRGDEVTEETIRGVRSIYYGMNAFIDDEVGRFLGELEKLGLVDETLVIYVSDHGEYLGEHRMIRKSKAAYDCLIRIPFIIRAPGAKGREIDEFVTLEDLMPTILSYAGLDIQASVQGRDLRPLLEGRDFPSRPFVYGEYSAHNFPVAPDTEYRTCESPLSPDFVPKMKLGGLGKMRFLRTKRWKLVVYVQDRPELYDLESDPYELENVYGRPGTEGTTSELKDLLIQQMMVVNHPGDHFGDVS